MKGEKYYEKTSLGNWDTGNGCTYESGYFAKRRWFLYGREHGTSAGRKWHQCYGAVYYTDLLPKEPALAGLIAAKKAGVTTAFNMQVGLETMEGLGLSKQEILDALAYVDIFAPCADGLYALTGTQDLEACVQILRPYCEGIFLFSYCLKKKGLKESMEFATACAAYTCTGMGARFSPTWQEVEHELD